jgi:hypothetical protein
VPEALQGQAELMLGNLTGCGSPVMQDVQTLQRQLLTFMVDRLQVANSQQ